MGSQNCTSGPVRHTATMVPAPTDPPRKHPRTTKKRSHPTLTQRNSTFSILSDRITATRSLGPVPALLLITIDIPAARITHPMSILATLRIMEESPFMYPPKSHVKKSMIGPPQNAHTTVPGFTYPFVVRSITTIRIQRTITWTVPTVRPKTTDRPWIKTVKVSVPRADKRNSVTPKCATVRPISSTIRATAQSFMLLPEVSDANFVFCSLIIYLPVI